MAVVGLEISSREPYAQGRSFGDVGTYDLVRARVHYAIDPNAPSNAGIIDLELATPGTDGRVRFAGDLILLMPTEPGRGSDRALVEAVNRGQPLSPRVFNRTPYGGPTMLDLDPGDGFLFRHGYTVAYLGWQWDVRAAGLLSLDAPPALVDGVPLEGTTVVEIRPTWRETTRLLANRTHQPYPAAEVDQPDAMLTVRDSDDGEVIELPRSRWSFARETAEGLQPSPHHVHLGEGFEPGRQYHVIYRTRGAPVVGAGLLAFRDIAAFLRASYPDNPVAGQVRRVYGFGMSQSGRFLRHFLSMGLNEDELGAAAYDGLIPHVAGGRRGEFNHRFAQPSVQLVPGFGHLPPFTDEVLTDPIAGTTDGLLRRQRDRGHVPKIMYVNTSAEYWRGDAWLTHGDALARHDLDLPDEVRSYHLASTQHFPGEVPQVDFNEHDAARGRLGFNTVEFTPVMRALLRNLDRWVVDGTQPPPSRLPRLHDGTAVERREVLDRLAGLVDQPLPDPELLPVVREVDLGPDAGRGIARHPVSEGRTYACLVSDVDADGNELAGVRLPDVTVPLGTHLGFNPRHPVTGAPEQIMSMQGSTLFFPRTQQERLEGGDPRRSIEERYADRHGFLDAVRRAAERLVELHLLLDEDIDLVVADGAARWDYVQAGAPLDEEPWRRATARVTS